MISIDFKLWWNTLKTFPHLMLNSLTGMCIIHVPLHLTLATLYVINIFLVRMKAIFETLKWVVKLI